MRWVKSEISPDQVRNIAKTYDLDLLTASILLRRGISDPEQIAFFLEKDLRFLHNPFLFTAMEDAVDRILLAAEEGEKVMVFGDSDTDGVTATTLMVEVLRILGIEASWRVPMGEEPYGLSMEAVESFALEKGSLIITVDCGISNHEEVERASELGVDVIVCDHHKLQVEKAPQAVAVIDPKIEGCGYPFRDLAGAGVALKVAMALLFAKTAFYKQSVALFAIRQGEKETLVEAVKIHNLVETARFSESLEAGSPRTAAVLERLARFLSGRSIFVYDKKSTDLYFRQIFGPGVDMESYDIAEDLGRLGARFRGKNLDQLAPVLGVSTYSSLPKSPIDVLATIFSLLAAAQSGLESDEIARFLQLAALGTIADLMPLKDENRIIVRHGVQGISTRPRQGIEELLKALGIRRTLSATEIAWQLTPLINAAGRVGSPDIALRLLLAEALEIREKAVEEILKANGERKRLGAEVWDSVYPLAAKSYESTNRRYILVGAKEVKSGITGLLASKMVGVFKVPAIVAAFKDNGVVVGSIRTANGMKISGLLSRCADLFIDYGGHDAAAGFSLRIPDWEIFLEKAQDYLRSVEMTVAEETILIDAELPHRYLKPEVYEIAQAFEPFGEENRPLVFFSKSVPVVDAQIVGKSAKSHLKLTLDFGTYKWPALLWDGADRLERDFSFKANDKIDILFKITMNRWNGEEKPQLELFDLRRAQADAKSADAQP
jgi:single-stranded-DNA-specific exonuclease